MKDSMRTSVLISVLVAVMSYGCRRQSNETAGTATPGAAQQSDNAGPPTSFRLIDKAVASGAIKQETGLLYKVYADFDDQRLPASYRRKEENLFEVRSLRQVAKDWSSLSQPTRDLLAPFLMRPDEPGNWSELPTASREASMHQRDSWSDLVTPPVAAASIQMSSVVVAVGGVNKARIWWRSGRQQDQARAQAFKTELEHYLWNKLTATFGEPLTDDHFKKIDGSNAEHGPDGLLDIYLARIPLSVTVSFQDVYHAPCDGSPHPATILLSPKADRSELGHELMHAIIDGYPLLTCHHQYTWMNEATAEWTMNFTYTDNKEHIAPPLLLDYPDERLNLLGGFSGLHKYGAYLWFFNLAGSSNDPGPVKATWQAAKNNDDIDAIDKVEGGFKKQWPIFLANNWNGMPDAAGPHRDYWEWDNIPSRAREEFFFSGGKRIVGVVDIALPNYGGARFPVYHELQPLAAQYSHFKFAPDPQMHQVWIKNDYAGADPRAVLQAIVKIKDEGWQRYKDWSNDKRHFFCRDVAKENIEEIVLILSNLDLENAQDFASPIPPSLGGDDTINESPVELNVSALPCNDWTGTVEYTETQRATGGDTIRTNAKANVRFTIDLGKSATAGGAVEYYKASGTVHWDIHEKVEYCATKNAFGNFAAEGSLVISLGADSLFYVLQNESEGSSTKVTVACEGGPSEFHFEFKQWLPPGFMGMLRGDAAEITGTRETDPGEGWKWHFTRVK